MDSVCSICSEGLVKPSGFPKQNGTTDLQVPQKSIAPSDPGVENIVGTLCRHVFHGVCLRKIFKDKSVWNCPKCGKEFCLTIVVSKQAAASTSTTNLSKLSPSDQQELKEVSELNKMLLNRTITLETKLNNEATIKKELELELTTVKAKLQQMEKEAEINQQKLTANGNEIIELKERHKVNLTAITSRNELEIKLKQDEFENFKSKRENEIKGIRASHAADLQEINAKHELQLKLKLEELEKSLNMKFKTEINKKELSISNFVNKIFADDDLKLLEEKEEENSIVPLPSTSKGLGSGIALNNISKRKLKFPQEIMETDDDDGSDSSDSKGGLGSGTMEMKFSSVSMVSSREVEQPSSQQVEPSAGPSCKDTSATTKNEVIQLGEGITINARKYQKCIKGDNIRHVAKNLLKAVFPRSAKWWAKATFKQRSTNEFYIVPSNITETLVDHLSTFGVPYRKQNGTLKEFQLHIRAGLYKMQQNARRTQRKEYKQRRQSRYKKTRLQASFKLAGDRVLGSMPKSRLGKKPKAKAIEVVD